jgi:GntR family transcriptional regulator, trigonelline degradation regulator
VEMRVKTDSESLREKATNVIREAIMSLHYKPGEALVERRLCEETGVSRTSIREALRLLEAEGLVRREGTRGLVVAELSSEEVRNMFDLRLLIEIELLSRFADRATGEQLSRMSDLLDAAASSAERDSDEYPRKITQFLQVIWDNSGNPIAAKLLGSLRGRTSYIRVILYRETSFAEHQFTIGLLRRILQGLQGGDVATSAKVYRRYLERARDRAVGIIETQEAAVTSVA